MCSADFLFLERKNYTVPAYKYHFKKKWKDSWSWSCQRENHKNGQNQFFVDKIVIFEVDDLIFLTLMGNIILNIIE